MIHKICKTLKEGKIKAQMINMSYVDNIIQVIYYFSGVPFLKYSEMYCVIREGKSRWVIKQIIHIFIMSFVFMLIAEVQGMERSL